MRERAILFAGITGGDEEAGETAGRPRIRSFLERFVFQPKMPAVAGGDKGDRLATLIGAPTEVQRSQRLR
jgi:hypothetical protein